MSETTDDLESMAWAYEDDLIHDLSELPSAPLDTVYCCECRKDVRAHEITGKEAYPHRDDLGHLKMWQCPRCKNFVGSYRDGRPLGCIPTEELKQARKRIHAALDPIWKEGHMARSEVYALLSADLGYEYHTAQIKTMEDARRVFEHVEALRKETMGEKGISNDYRWR